MNILPKHDHSQSRLRCQDCEETICPKCMVQCAVGARCHKCAGRFTSHVIQTTPVILIRTALAGLVVGFIYGNLQTSFHLLSYSLISWAILVFGGIGVGRILHRIAAHKLGAKIVSAVLAGLLLGVLLSPVRDTLSLYITLLGQPAATEEGSAQASTLLTQLFSVLLFVGAAVSPFLRKS